MPAAGTDTAARPARSGAASNQLLLVLAGVIVGGSRWWATRHATFPYISADEPAYLSMARWLGGRGGWILGEAAVYGPGYSVLIAPWAALDLSPDTQYRAAILTNVALGVVAYVVLERLIRRLTTMQRPWSIVVALTGTMTASTVLLSGYAWSDSAAVAVFLLSAFACVGLVDRPTAGRAFTTATIAVAAFAVHYRFAPLALVVVTLLALLACARRVDLRVALGAGAVTVLGIGLVQLLSHVIHDRLYEGGGAGAQTSSFLGRVTSPFDILVSVAGQLLYLAVTTGGLAVLGVIALVTALRRSTPADPIRSRPAAMTVLALVTVTFLASAVFMSDGTRGDHAIYGRYNDAFVGLLIALGVVRLAATRPLRQLLIDLLTVAAVVGASWVVVASARADQLRVPYNGLTIRSLVPLGDGGSTQLLRFTLVGLAAVGVIGGFAALFRRRPALVVTFAAVLMLAGTGRAVERTDGPRDNDPRAAASIPGVVGSDDRVAYVLAPSIGQGSYFRFPFYAPELRLFRTAEPVWERGQEWIMAPTDFAPVVDAGYEPVWTDPVSGQRLWHAAGSDES